MDGLRLFSDVYEASAARHDTCADCARPFIDRFGSAFHTASTFFTVSSGDFGGAGSSGFSLRIARSFCKAVVRLVAYEVMNALATAANDIFFAPGVWNFAV